MHNVEKDSRVFVHFRDGNVKVYENVEVFAKIVRIDREGKPYLKRGHDFRCTNFGTIGHNWNDVAEEPSIGRWDYITRFVDARKNDEEYERNSPANVIITNSSGCVFHRDFLYSIATEDVKWNGDKKKKAVELHHGDVCEKAWWRQGRGTYVFRQDPVPGIHNWNKGGPSCKVAAFVRILREFDKAKADGIPTRAKHKNSVIDTWGDRRRTDGFGSSSKSWKNKKIKKQWMKNEKNVQR